MATAASPEAAISAKPSQPNRIAVRLVVAELHAGTRSRPALGQRLHAS
jgi:hypothetical protein